MAEIHILLAGCGGSSLPVAEVHILLAACVGEAVCLWLSFTVKELGVELNLVKSSKFQFHWHVSFKVNHNRKTVWSNSLYLLPKRSGQTHQ